MQPSPSDQPTARPVTHRRLAPALATLMLASILLAACGGSTPAATTGAGGGGSSAAPAASAGGGGAASTSDMCALISKDEVGAAAGDTVTTVEPDTKGCTWTLSKLNAINLRIETDEASDFSAQKLLFPDGRDVQGLGDRAFWGPSLAVLYSVFKGKTYAVQLVLFANDDARNLATATSIMKTAFSRL